MGIVRTLPELESWLDDHADDWAPLHDREYKAVVGRWSGLFGPLIEAGSSAGDSRATAALKSRLPCDVFLFSGLRVERLLNTGGRGAAAYEAVGLCDLDTELANILELVAVSVDFSWCCVFSHEAGSWVWERLYEREQVDTPGLSTR